MIYGSVCSGIEAASVAWKPLGWSPAWFMEVEPFASAVLAQRHGGTPNLGDMLAVREADLGSIDLLVGGTPCQSFSVAGLRGGLDDPRGNLALRFVQLAGVLRPRWVVWENVPGVLSSGEGRDFGSILGGLDQLGYGCFWRVLDAQFVRVDGHERAVPQRRRRVFLVGHLGDWRRAAAVLLERHCLSGHPAPRREAGQGVTGSLASRASAGGGLGTDFDCGGGLIPEVSPAMKSRDCKGPSSDGDGDGDGLPLIVSHSLRAEGFDAGEDGTGRGTPIVPIGYLVRSNQGSGGNLPSHDDSEASVTLTRQMGENQIPAVAFAIQERAGETGTGGPEGAGFREGVAYTIEARHRPQNVAASGVRRLTPRECERLQGFPDDYTLIDYRGKPAKDGPRYRALGNSMAVNVMRWIGRRIEMVEAFAGAPA